MLNVTHQHGNKNHRETALRTDADGRHTHRNQAEPRGAGESAATRDTAWRLLKKLTMQFYLGACAGTGGRDWHRHVHAHVHGTLLTAASGGRYPGVHGS